KKEIFDTKSAITKREKELIRIKSEYEELQNYLEENKRTILKKAKEEAQLLLKNSNKLIENTVSEIKSAQADKEKTKEIRAKLDSSFATILPKDKKVDKKPVTVADLTEEIAVGDWVKIIDSEN